MFRSLISAGLAVAAIFAGVFLAGAAHADELADQCHRATIPTPLCDGTGGVAPSADDGVSGRVDYVQHAAYFSGNGPDVVIGEDHSKPLKNADGTPKLDGAGRQEYADITAPGPAIFTAYPDTAPGKVNGDGDLEVDESGYHFAPAS
jgi:hypothetical protein